MHTDQMLAHNRVFGVDKRPMLYQCHARKLAVLEEGNIQNGHVTKEQAATPFMIIIASLTSICHVLDNLHSKQCISAGVACVPAAAEQEAKDKPKESANGALPEKMTFVCNV